MKKSFMLYYDYQEHLNLLTDAEIGRLIIALFEYAECGVFPQLDGMVKMAFSFIRSQIDRDNQKYLDKCARNKQSIEQRWNKVDTNVYERTKPDTKNTDTVTVTEKGTVTDIDTYTHTDTDTDTVILST